MSLNIVIVEDNPKYLESLSGFLQSQQHIPCTVHAIDPCTEKYNPDPADVVKAIKRVATGNTIVLLDNELGDFPVGEVVAKEIKEMKILSIATLSTEYGIAHFGGKRSLDIPEMQEILIEKIQEVLAS